MTTAIMLILALAASGGAPAAHEVEFATIELCEAALPRILQMDGSGAELQVSATCITVSQPRDAIADLIERELSR